LRLGFRRGAGLARTAGTAAAAENAADDLTGRSQDDEWIGAARRSGFCTSDGVAFAAGGQLLGGLRRQRVVHRRAQPDPPGGKILSRVTPLPEGGDARTWTDDSIEMILDPLHTDASGRRRIYHANINAKGAINDTAYSHPAAGKPGAGTGASRARSSVTSGTSKRLCRSVT
jgi:hypothetical protein